MTTKTHQFATIMPGETGLDYASWRPTMAQLASLGVTYVSRYMCNTTQINKWIFKPEVEQLHAAGIGLILNWEQTADAWVNGKQRGRDHGDSAVRYAKNLGAPPGTTLVFSYDTNVGAGDMRAYDYGMGAYERCLVNGYQFGVYADLDVMRMLREVSSLNWLAGATSWSSPKYADGYHPERQPDYDLVHVRQYIAGSTPNYDRNVALRPFQVWLPHEVQEEIEILPPVINHQLSTTVQPPKYTSEEDDIMVAGKPTIIGHPDYPHRFLVNAGAPRWLGEQEYSAERAAGTPEIVERHDSFLIVAARAGVQL